MKNLLVLLFIFVLSAARGQDVAVLRKEFIEASSSKSNSEKFSKSTAEISAGSKPQLLAYKAAALVISSKFVPQISDKKKNAKEGITLLESAVSKEPENIETRVIRLSIQENSPKILKYKGNIQEDKDFVLKNYGKLAAGGLKTFVEGYIRNSSSFSEAEKQLR